MAPTAQDPLGQRENPADFGEAMNKVIDARVEMRIRGRTMAELSNIPDMRLVQELLARGWAVFRPSHAEDQRNL